MNRTGFAILLVGALLVPMASGTTLGESQEDETCKPPDESDRTFRIGGETFHLKNDTLWRERNSEVGLQTSAGVCHADDDGIPDNVWSPDQPVFAATVSCASPSQLGSACLAPALP